MLKSSWTETGAAGCSAKEPSVRSPHGSSRRRSAHAALISAPQRLCRAVGETAYTLKERAPVPPGGRGPFPYLAAPVPYEFQIKRFRSSAPSAFPLPVFERQRHKPGQRGGRGIQKSGVRAAAGPGENFNPGVSKLRSGRIVLPHADVVFSVILGQTEKPGAGRIRRNALSVVPQLRQIRGGWI